MTDLVGELRSRRLVRELDPVRRPGAGRPTRPIALDGEPWCVLGASIDLDRVEVSMATAGGRELWQDTVAITREPNGGGINLRALQEILAAQVLRLPDHLMLVAVELAVPGFVTAGGDTVSWSADLGWRDLPLSSSIGQFLARRGSVDVHVRVANDAQLAALYAVRVELALPEHSVAAYLGGRRHIAGAIIVDGEIFSGAQGGAGDFAHLSIDPAGPSDSCGRRGCLESLVGLRQLLVGAELASTGEAETRVTADPGASVQLLADAAARGSPRSLEVLAQAGAVLGRAIDNIVGTINPDVVILGGHLGVLSPYMNATVESALEERFGVPAYADTQVVPLGATNRQVVMGAALAARDACLYDPLTWTVPLGA